MISDKTIFTTDSIQNIEEAIIEFGTVDCPNLLCFDELTSEVKWEQEKGKVIVYHCQNSKCNYHTPRQILIVNEPNQDKNILKKVSYNNIFTSVGICLFAILSFTSYYLYSVNKNLIENLAENKTEIVAKGQPTFSANQEVSKLNGKPLFISKKIDRNNPLEESEKLTINAFAEQTRTWIAAGNFEKGKLNIKRLVENKKYQSALLLPENDLTRSQLIELVGYSYEKNKKQFTHNFLQQISDFEMWKKFIEIYDVEKKYTDVYLGRAYLYLPNKLKNEISSNERKKIQLTALVHYLQAAKNNNFVGQKLSSIKAMNELSKAYLIFKHNPNKPNNFKTIETLIESNSTLEIQSRIDYVNKIIDRIS